MISFIGMISVLGVALGVAALITVISVMNGFDLEIRDKIIGTYAHGMVLKQGGISPGDDVFEVLKNSKGVLDHAGFVTGQAVLRKDKAVSGILLKGIDPAEEARVTKLVEFTGNSTGAMSDGAIILGRELMRDMDINVGDTIELMVPYSPVDMEKVKLEVSGVFSSGRYDYDANMAIVPLREAQELFRMGDRVSGVGFRVEDEMKANYARDSLQDALGRTYVIKSWMDMDSNLVKAVALEKKMMFIILTLIITVACFNIAGSLMMMVMEKTRDIGILRALGANPRGIGLIFLVEGAIIGVLGVMVGGVAGVALSDNINAAAKFIEDITGWTFFPSDVYYFTEIPSRISMPDVTAIITVALALTLCAGLYPAWKAARLDPVDAIRYE